jgi:hypothetical protein
MALPRTLFAVLVCGLLVFAPPALAPVGHADSRPTRSECIVGFRLDWSSVKADRHDVRNSLRMEPQLLQRIEAFAASTINPDGTRMYLQFKRDCDKKQDLAAQVIAFWQSKSMDLPRFERIDEPIVPSLDTIEATGPSWRD